MHVEIIHAKCESMHFKEYIRIDTNRYANIISLLASLFHDHYVVNSP